MYACHIVTGNSNDFTDKQIQIIRSFDLQKSLVAYTSCLVDFFCESPVSVFPGYKPFHFCEIFNRTNYCELTRFLT